jgi:hypothetical protein
MWHETDMTGLVGDVRSRGLNGSGVYGPSGPFLTRTGLPAMARDPGFA